MKYRLMSLVSSIFAAGLAGAAFAADPPGQQTATAQDLQKLRDFSRCVVRGGPNQSRRILALDYRTDEYSRSLRNLAVSLRPCKPYGGSLRMASMLLAGGLAEALLPRALGSRNLVTTAAYDPATVRITARDDSEYLALCAVRSMPDKVSALLATDPASDAEKQAVGAITPGLGPCLRAGAAATLNRPALRALLALAAYRTATATQPTAGN